MSSLDLFGVPLKLSRLFLKLCKWILLKMSLNCKVVSSNGKLPANFKVKKGNETLIGSNCGYLWRSLFLSVFLVVLVGLFGCLFFWNHGGLQMKLETTDSCDSKSGVLVEHFNVSKEEYDALISSFYVSEQITCLKCTRQSKRHMPYTSSGINCAFVVPTFEHQRFAEEHEYELKDAGLQEQCPVPSENTDSLLEERGSVSGVLRSTFSSIKSALQIYGEYMQTREPDNFAREQCKSISFCLANLLWCGIIGFAICSQISGFSYKFWGTKAMPLQQLPLPQNQMFQQKQHQQSQISSRSAGKWRMKLLLAFVFVGVIGSIWLFWHMNEDIVFRRKETLQICVMNGPACYRTSLM